MHAEKDQEEYLVESFEYCANKPGAEKRNTVKKKKRQTNFLSNFKKADSCLIEIDRCGIRYISMILDC